MQFMSDALQIEREGDERKWEEEEDNETISGDIAVNLSLTQRPSDQRLKCFCSALSENLSKFSS